MVSFKIGRATQNRIERIYLFYGMDYFIRYYGSKMGILWAFLNPFLKILIYYFVFSYIIYRQSNPEFLLKLFAGMLLWQFFTEATSHAIHLFNSRRFILQNIQINKVDFFISDILSKFMGLFVNILIYLLFAFLFFNKVYGLEILFLPIVVFNFLLFTLGVMFILSTMYIRFRDLDHLWTIVIMAGFWTVPIVWDYKIVLQNIPQLTYNPLMSYFVNVQEILIDNHLPTVSTFLYGFIFSVSISIIGYFYMKFGSRKALEVL
ncbi:MAG: ABC transporter permease [Bacteroidales bacterium]|nr:ABC transporter permease [Bacteroidales bacterium]